MSLVSLALAVAGSAVDRLDLDHRVLGAEARALAEVLPPAELSDDDLGALQLPDGSSRASLRRPEDEEAEPR